MIMDMITLYVFTYLAVGSGKSNAHHSVLGQVSCPPFVLRDHRIFNQQPSLFFSAPPSWMI